MKFKPSELGLWSFSKSYKRSIVDFPSGCKDLYYASGELFMGLINVTLPITMIVVWPMVYVFGVLRSAFK